VKETKVPKEKSEAKSSKPKKEGGEETKTKKEKKA